MNEAGLQYINKANSLYAKLPKNKRRKFTNEEVFERCMRLGIEARKFQLEQNEVHIMAEATLKEDLAKTYGR